MNHSRRVVCEIRRRITSDAKQDVQRAKRQEPNSVVEHPFLKQARLGLKSEKTREEKQAAAPPANMRTGRAFFFLGPFASRKARRAVRHASVTHEAQRSKSLKKYLRSSDNSKRSSINIIIIVVRDPRVGTNIKMAGWAR